MASDIHSVVIFSYYLISFYSDITPAQDMTGEINVVQSDTSDQDIMEQNVFVKMLFDILYDSSTRG